MVRIRLRRVGSKKQPSYRVVAANKEAPRDGRFLEVLGHYNPRTQPETIHLEEDRVFHWLSVGAQPSDSVAQIFKVTGTMERYQRFQAGEAIEKLIQERSWFMMRVAHNLRSPLAAIISMLDVVRGGYQGELTESQREYMRRVDRRARTMLSLIKELLTLAKNRDEKRIHAFKAVDLTVIAKRIQRTFQDEAHQKGLKFEMIVSNDLPNIQGDADMIEQTLENLVSNAIKYTPEGGTVCVEFSKGREDTVQIQISDTGIGIPKRDRPHLFDEFFRADNAKAVEEHGTGLGLSIVNEAVDQHHGRIVVESEENLGTLFVVHFPIDGKA